jgi:hypothetical protein
VPLWADCKLGVVPLGYRTGCWVRQIWLTQPCGTLCQICPEVGWRRGAPEGCLERLQRRQAIYAIWISRIARTAIGVSKPPCFIEVLKGLEAFSGSYAASAAVRHDELQAIWFERASSGRKCQSLPVVSTQNLRRRYRVGFRLYARIASARVPL